MSILRCKKCKRTIAIPYHIEDKGNYVYMARITNQGTSAIILKKTSIKMVTIRVL